jgi:hypothetical protein
MVVAMTKLKIFAVAVLLFALSGLTPSVAQQYGREYGRSTRVNTMAGWMVAPVTMKAFLQV